MNYTELAIGNGFKKPLQRYDTNDKVQTSLILLVSRLVNNIQQSVEQDHFSFHYNSLLYPHTDVNLTLT